MNGKTRTHGQIPLRQGTPIVKRYVEKQFTLHVERSLACGSLLNSSVTVNQIQNVPKAVTLRRNNQSISDNIGAQSIRSFPPSQPKHSSQEKRERPSAGSKLSATLRTAHNEKTFPFSYPYTSDSLFSGCTALQDDFNSYLKQKFPHQNGQNVKLTDN